VKAQGNWFDAPNVAFYGTGNDSATCAWGFRIARHGRRTAQFNVAKPFAMGAGWI
jgi:hypothetical protein